MASTKFSLFHLSLMPVSQVDIETLKISREDWLRKVFSEPFAVPYRSADLVHWVPQQSPQRDILMGVIQKELTHTFHEPPEKGGAEIQESEWQGAYVVIDPTPNLIGQRIAVEHDVVGLPQTLLKKIFDYLNQRPDRPYNIEFDPIFDGSSFWAFAKQNNNRLRYICFYFAAPNMWSATTELERELADTRTETGAERVSIKFASNDHIKADAKRIEEGVGYAERGAGDISAQATTGKRFTSKKKQKKTEVPKPVTDEVDKLSYLSKMWHSILGRENDDLSAKKGPSLDNPNGPNSGSLDDK
jgi:hypothetical protein